jgi:hypothetical protein
MADILEDTELIRDALAYVTELYEELTQENGAPTLGLQNQAVDLIRSDPGLRAAVTAWGRGAAVDEATTAPPRRLPYDAAYERVRAFLISAMDVPIMVRQEVTRT